MVIGLLLILTYVLLTTANQMHYFSYLFDKILYMLRTGPLSIVSSISTLYTGNNNNNNNNNNRHYYYYCHYYYYY